MKTKYVILFSLVMLISSTCVIAQVDTIRQEKSKFYYLDKRVTPKQMLTIVQSVPEAAALMSKAKSNYTLASIMGFTGGFLIGWPLGTAIGGGDPNWGLVGIGAGIALLSIPVTVSSTKKASEAVDIYNRKIREISYQPDMRFQLGQTKNGIGLLIKF